MSTSNENSDAPAGQGDYETKYEQIAEYLQSIGLSVSEQLTHHAASTNHEDLPHDSADCARCCMPKSSGTVTPTKPASERLCSLIPPPNYGAVIPDAIYRSSYPQEKNYEFLKNLKIKSILTLVPEPISPEYQAFMDGAGIQHFHAHIKANKEGKVRVESCEMSRALRLIMDRTNHPILIHCNKGKHRTGCTVACFRRFLGTRVEDIREEYHTYAGVKARFLDEVFFENFDLNLVMWMARQEGWAKPEADITLLSPPDSPLTSAVGACVVTTTHLE
ncbi:tyrosine-protein phosphatase-like protein SIW14 [Dothidotthia symphoricarpi CBS 119687]|uniref:diphosphoinositol-polyphosphate diphosphatase n=1 Tax=Dothidotthia symphoricarpi CBS 119687 TaxID=1392245 RepID=A0A6A6A7Y2_9PLEO|nr:tyrosine-protein phosphatase-like protein SIW14 [Dothidotthia symphoricarpi CBS 119687]KAF2127273.1 tyrosine-protein phosphatase-like protein SIW14 [Dothidotthia symphoricarpi CBS 119687]